MSDLPEDSRGVNFILERSKAPRIRAPFRIGARTADFRRMLAFWIDLVEDPDITARRDPMIHLRMMRDPQIYACFMIRSLATASLPTAIIARNDTQEAKMYQTRVEKIFNNIPNFPRVTKNMLTAVPQGLSIQEVLWTIDENLWTVPHNLFPVHKDRFVADLDGNLALRSPLDMFWGEAVPPRTFIPHTFDQLPGSFMDPEEEGRIIFGLGLHDVLYPTWFAKQIILRMDLRYLERFGNPTRIGKYPRKNNESREALRQLIDDLSHEQIALFPSDEGYELEHYEAAGGGHRGFQDLIDYFDRQFSKAYLGSTLLLDIGDVGSYSLGRIHERTTFGRVAEYDHAAIASTFNTYLIPWLFELNNWPKAFMPSFAFTMKESQDIAEVIEALRVLQTMGYSVSAEMVSEQTGFRKPREGETILSVMTNEEGAVSSVDQRGGQFDLLSPRGRGKLVEATTQAIGPQLMQLRKQLENLQGQMLSFSAEAAMRRSRAA